MPQPRHTESSILQSYLLPPSPLPTILPYIAFLQLVPAQHRSHPHLKRLYRDLQFQRNIDIDTVRQNIAREVSRSAILKGQLARAIDSELGSTTSDTKSTNGDKTRKRKRPTNDNDNGNEGNTASNDRDDEFTDPKTLAIDTTYLTSSIHPAHTNTISSANHHPLTTGTRAHHTPATLISSLATTCSDLETEITDLDDESSRLLAEMNEIVGSLSDLRYGRFARPVSGNGGVDGGYGDKTVEDEILEALAGLERRLEKVVG